MADDTGTAAADQPPPQKRARLGDENIATVSTSKQQIEDLTDEMMDHDHVEPKPETPSISTISDKELLSIISYLPLSQQIATERVCHFWAPFTHTSTREATKLVLYSSSTYQQILSDIGRYRFFTDSTQNWIPDLHDAIDISCSASTLLPSKMAWLQTRFTSRLTHLAIYNVDGLSVEQFASLLEGWPEIEVLEVFTSKRVRGEYNVATFWDAVDGLKKLKKIHLPFEPCEVEAERLTKLYERCTTMYHCMEAIERNFARNPPIHLRLAEIQELQQAQMTRLRERITENLTSSEFPLANVCILDNDGRHGRFLLRFAHSPKPSEPKRIVATGVSVYSGQMETSYMANQANVAKLEVLTRGDNVEITHLDLELPSNALLKTFLPTMRGMKELTHLRLTSRRVTVADEAGRREPILGNGNFTDDDAIPKITSLTLVHFDLIDVQETLIRVLAKLFPNIEELHFEDCRFGERQEDAMVRALTDTWPGLTFVWSNGALLFEVFDDEDEKEIRQDVRKLMADNRASLERLYDFARERAISSEFRYRTWNHHHIRNNLADLLFVDFFDAVMNVQNDPLDDLIGPLGAGPGIGVLQANFMGHEMDIGRPWGAPAAGNMNFGGVAPDGGIFLNLGVPAHVPPPLVLEPEGQQRVEEELGHLRAGRQIVEQRQRRRDQRVAERAREAHRALVQRVAQRDLQRARDRIVQPDLQRARDRLVAQPEGGVAGGAAAPPNVAPQRPPRNQPMVEIRQAQNRNFEYQLHPGQPIPLMVMLNRNRNRDRDRDGLPNGDRIHLAARRAGQAAPPPRPQPGDEGQQAEVNGIRENRQEPRGLMNLLQMFQREGAAGGAAVAARREPVVAGNEVPVPEEGVAAPPAPPALPPLLEAQEEGEGLVNGNAANNVANDRPAANDALPPRPHGFALPNLGNVLNGFLQNAPFDGDLMARAAVDAWGVIQARPLQPPPAPAPPVAPLGNVPPLAPPRMGYYAGMIRRRPAPVARAARPANLEGVARNEDVPRRPQAPRRPARHLPPLPPLPLPPAMPALQDDGPGPRMLLQFAFPGGRANGAAGAGAGMAQFGQQQAFAVGPQRAFRDFREALPHVLPHRRGGLFDLRRDPGLVRRAAREARRVAGDEEVPANNPRHEQVYLNIIIRQIRESLRTHPLVVMLAVPELPPPRAGAAAGLGPRAAPQRPPPPEPPAGPDGVPFGGFIAAALLVQDEANPQEGVGQAPADVFEIPPRAAPLFRNPPFVAHRHANEPAPEAVPDGQAQAQGPVAAAAPPPPPPPPPRPPRLEPILDFQPLQPPQPPPPFRRRQFARRSLPVPVQGAHPPNAGVAEGEGPVAPPAAPPVAPPAAAQDPLPPVLPPRPPPRPVRRAAQPANHRLARRYIRAHFAGPGGPADQPRPLAGHYHQFGPYHPPGEGRQAFPWANEPEAFRERLRDYGQATLRVLADARAINDGGRRPQDQPGPSGLGVAGPSNGVAKAPPALEDGGDFAQPRQGLKRRPFSQLELMDMENPWEHRLDSPPPSPPAPFPDNLNIFHNANFLNLLDDGVDDAVVDFFAQDPPEDGGEPPLEPHNEADPPELVAEGHLFHIEDLDDDEDDDEVD